MTRRVIDGSTSERISGDEALCVKNRNTASPLCKNAKYYPTYIMQTLSDQAEMEAKHH